MTIATRTLCTGFFAFAIAALIAHAETHAQPLSGPQRFAFETGGPVVRQSVPSDGQTIEEGQYFLLRFNGATWTSVTSPTPNLLIQLWGAPGSTEVYGAGVVTTIVRGSR